jgi:signal transduction histidine kinase
MIAGSLLATILMGVFVLLAQPKRKPNQFFALLSAVIFIWQTALWGGAYSNTVFQAMFWIKSSSVLGALIPPSMNLLRISIVYTSISFWDVLKVNRKWFISWSIISLLCLTKIFLQNAKLPSEGELLVIPDYGVGFLLYILYFLTSFSMLFYKIHKDCKKFDGVRRTEIEYILLSCGAGLFIGVFFLIVPNLTGWIDLGALLPLSVITFVAITGYGIATQGILDVPVLARRIIAYTMLLLYLIILYFIVLLGSKVFLIWVNQPPEPLSHLLATLAVVFSISPAQGISQGLANRLFISTPPLNVGRILREAGSTLNSVLTVDDLCIRFSQILTEKLETRDLQILIRHQNQFIQIYPVIESHRQSESTSLPELLKSDSRLYVRDLIQRHKLTSHTQQILDELRSKNASAAISLTRNDRLFGILLLGERASGRLYAHEEALAVEGLRDLFCVSYENARLYTELQNSRIYMDLLLKNLVNGVLATDASGTITTCNHEAASILRTDPDQICGKSMHELPPPLEAVLQQVFEKDEVVKDREIILPRNGEGSRSLNVGASLFKDLEQNVIGSLLVLQDRTAIRALEEQVKRSERLASLGTLSAGMAHEIKNPLVTLKTFTQLLPERFEDPDFRETFSNLADKEIGRIDTLVNQLLSFARPAKPKLEPMHLHDLLKSHIKWFRHQAENSNIKIEEHYGTDQDLILADDDQLRQVFLNLLLNAQQVMPEGGTISLRTRRSGFCIRVTVSDTGKGIIPDDLDHVFDPFFTTKSSGTGLGLAVAHQILIEHKSEIRVTSQLGEGSNFDLYFPLHQPDPPA